MFFGPDCNDCKVKVTLGSPIDEWEIHDPRSEQTQKFESFKAEVEVIKEKKQILVNHIHYGEKNIEKLFALNAFLRYLVDKYSDYSIYVWARNVPDSVDYLFLTKRFGFALDETKIFAASPQTGQVQLKVDAAAIRDIVR